MHLVEAAVDISYIALGLVYILAGLGLAPHNGPACVLAALLGSFLHYSVWIAAILALRFAAFCMQSSTLAPVWHGLYETQLNSPSIQNSVRCWWLPCFFRINYLWATKNKRQRISHLEGL